MDPSYNSPLLRRASAARAPGTNSFNDVVDHIAALTTTDLDVDSPTAAAGQRIEFCRSAATIIPVIRQRVGAMHNFLDGRTQEDCARAPVSSDLSGDHHAANARDNGFSRLTFRERPFRDGTCSPPIIGDDGCPIPNS